MARREIEWGVNQHVKNMQNDKLSGHIVDAAIEVHRVLGGPGLIESVYEEALAWELERRGIQIQRQVTLPITYKGMALGAPLRIDLLVGNCIIVECKAVSQHNVVFEAQVLTYFKDIRPASGLRHQFW